MDWWSEERRRRERRRRIMGAITAVVAALALIIMTVAPSFADSRGYDSFDVEATAHADGRLEVGIDVEYSFGEESGHGIYLAFVTRQEIDGDPEHWRVLRFGPVRASSPTAPADVRVEEWDDGIGIYLGDPDISISGTHTYRLDFTIEGVVNPGAGAGGSDEIYWNVISAADDEVIERIAVTLNAPAEAEQVGCWYGPSGADYACRVDESQADSLVFGNLILRGGSGLTIAAAYPPGTFPGAAPILIDRPTFRSTMGGWPTGIIAGVASILALILTPWGYRAVRRDQQYLGLTPGLTPSGSGVGASAESESSSESAPEALVGPAPLKPDPAVQFVPPPDLRPAEVGMLVDRVFMRKHIVPTIVDLAVRGYLFIETVGEEKDKSNWLLKQGNEDTDGLKEYEAKLLDILFSTGSEVDFDFLTQTQRSRIDSLIRKENNRLSERGWFLDRSGSAKYRAVALGLVIALVGVVALLIMAVKVGYALLTIPVIITGVAIMGRSMGAVARSADGYALYIHSLGFKKYLATAEAGQLRFEAGEDIFSRYLPYAIVFGVVEHWVELFAALAEEGEWDTTPTWYVGDGSYAHLLSSNKVFTSNLQGAQAAAAVSGMVSATSGSSGGSAFSGGGFSGGGVGGGSAGSW